MVMHADVMKAQAATLDLWGKEWRTDAGSGVAGAAEIGWQLARIAKLVRAVAGAPAAADADADAVDKELPPPATGELKAG